jgi:hypothetical protein
LSSSAAEQQLGAWVWCARDFATHFGAPFVAKTHHGVSKAMKKK